MANKFSSSSSIKKSFRNNLNIFLKKDNIVLLKNVFEGAQVYFLKCLRAFELFKSLRVVLRALKLAETLQP